MCSPSGEVSYSTVYTESLSIPPTIVYKPVVADFDGDALSDLAIGTQAGPKVFIGNGCKGAESTWWREMPLAGRGGNVMQICTSDIGKDGKVDITTAYASGLMVLLNNGRIELDSPADTTLPSNGEYSGYCLFDFEGDGYLDTA